MVEDGLGEVLRLLDVREMGGPLEDVESCARNPRRDELGVLDRGRRVLGARDDECGRGDGRDPIARIPGADGLTAARVSLRRR